MIYVSGFVCHGSHFGIRVQLCTFWVSDHRVKSLIYHALLGCTPSDRLQINGQPIQDRGLKICGMYNRTIAFDRGMRSVGVLIVGVAKRSCYL